ncbi:hypothetical protein SDC9_147364 [bioreactor metagenome]|uniref:Uncharacterized protein n=1 Tax=bioreactor metagenome TaxID=1076179 RepID=A0A645EFP5_9ZZZZ
MQQQHKRLFRRQAEQLVDAQAVVAQGLGQVIAEGHGEQLAQALHRVLPAGHGQAPRIKARGDRFTRRVFVKPGHRGAHVAGQPGAFEQALGVDHQVVFG